MREPRILSPFFCLPFYSEVEILHLLYQFPLWHLHGFTMRRQMSFTQDILRIYGLAVVTWCMVWIWIQIQELKQAQPNVVNINAVGPEDIAKHTHQDSSGGQTNTHEISTAARALSLSSHRVTAVSCSGWQCCHKRAFIARALLKERCWFCWKEAQEDTNMSLEKCSEISKL